MLSFLWQKPGKQILSFLAAVTGTCSMPPKSSENFQTCYYCRMTAFLCHAKHGRLQLLTFRSWVGYNFRWNVCVLELQLEIVHSGIYFTIWSNTLFLQRRQNVLKQGSKLQVYSKKVIFSSHIWWLQNLLLNDA